MNKLLNRYFDGDLSDLEAEHFMDTVSRDPELAATLRRYEYMLTEARQSPPPPLSTDFTDSVMAEIAATEMPPVSRPGSAFFARPLNIVAAAACLLLFFGLGYYVPHGGIQVQSDPLVTLPLDNLVQGQLTSATYDAGTDGLRIVRLEYTPTRGNIENVAVAGTFNNWSRQATPMQHEDGRWFVLLALQPGVHEYLFVENDSEWVCDPLALQTRDDGFGNSNAVLDLAI